MHGLCHQVAAAARKKFAKAQPRCHLPLAPFCNGCCRVPEPIRRADILSRQLRPAEQAFSLTSNSRCCTTSLCLLLLCPDYRQGRMLQQMTVQVKRCSPYSSCRVQRIRVTVEHWLSTVSISESGGCDAHAPLTVPCTACKYLWMSTAWAAALLQKVLGHQQ